MIQIRRRSFLILVLICIVFSGCIFNKKEVNNIKISVEKNYVMPDGVDGVFINTEMYDSLGNLVDGFSGNYYANEKKIEGPFFKTTKSDKYEIYVKLGNIQSNKILIESECTINLTDSYSFVDISEVDKSFTFTVKTSNEGFRVDSKKVKYFVNNQEISGSTFTPERTGEYVVKAKYGAMETPPITKKVLALKDLTIGVNKTELKSDGIDSTLISIISLIDENGIDIKEKYGNEVVTYYSKKMDCYNGLEKLDSTAFKTMKNGLYDIYAKYGNITSNKITIYADLQLKLTTSRTIVDIEDTNKSFDFSLEAVTPGVILDPKNIKYLVNNQEIIGSTFIPEKTGEYIVKAKYGEIESPSIKIDVFTVTSASIIMSKKEIVPNGIDISTLSSIKIFNERGIDVKEKYSEEFQKYYGDKIALYNGEGKLASYEFKNTRSGTYNIYAKYRNISSNIESVSAFVAINFSIDRYFVDIASDNKTVQLITDCMDSSKNKTSQEGVWFKVDGNKVTGNQYTFSKIGTHFVDAGMGDEVLSSLTVEVYQSKYLFDFETMEVAFENTYTWTTGGLIDFERDVGGRAGRTLFIEANTIPNDIVMNKTLMLKPKTTYRLSGYMKGENVVIYQGGTLGAFLGIRNLPIANESKGAGTFDWRKIEQVFTTPNDGATIIQLSIGGFSSTATGKVWFDDIMVEEIVTP